MRLCHSFVTALIVLATAGYSNATHLRGGEITVQQDATNPLSFQATLVLFTDPGSVSDEDSAVINWGDGTIDTVARTSFDFVSSDIQKNVFTSSHAYALVPFDSVVYVSYSGLNRVAGINNINAGNSVDIPMYFHTALNLKQLQYTLGNSTARLLSEIPIAAYATVPLYHDLQPFDADSDTYYVDTYIPMADSQGTVTNYLMPDAFGGTYGVNGDLVEWVTPMYLSRLNVGFRIHEFRNGKWLSTTFRDAFVFVDMPTGIGTADSQLTALYPNPTDGFISLHMHDPTLKKLIVFDPMGRSLFETPISTSSTSFDLSFLPQGYYFIQVCGDNETEVLALVIQ